MSGFSREEPKPPPFGLDPMSRARQRAESILNPEKVNEIFPEGSRAPWKTVYPYIEALMKEANFNMKSEEERGVFLGILGTRVPAGRGPDDLRKLISDWLPPQ